MIENVYATIFAIAEFSMSTRWLAVPFAIAFCGLIAGGILSRYGRGR